MDRAFRALTIFTVALILVGAAEISLLLKKQALFLSAGLGAVIPQVELNAVTKLSVRLVPLSLIVFVAYLISLSVFTFVAYRGLTAARVPHLRFTPVSAALLYFVPIWNLVHLLMVLQEMFRASQHDVTKADWLDWREEERSDRISAAWLFITGGLLFDTVGAVFIDLMPQPDVLVLVFRARAITALFGLIALLLFLGAIASIARRVDSLPVEAADSDAAGGPVQGLPSAS
jgi:hypothetical protein